MFRKRLFAGGLMLVTLIYSVAWATQSDHANLFKRPDHVAVPSASDSGVQDQS